MSIIFKPPSLGEKNAVTHSTLFLTPTDRPKSILNFRSKVPKLWHASELAKEFVSDSKLSIIKALNSNNLTHTRC